MHTSQHFIGNSIDGPAGEQIRAETRKQDILLDQVELALDVARVQAEVSLSVANLSAIVAAISVVETFASYPSS
jgi:hypothetical protein